MTRINLLIVTLFFLVSCQEKAAKVNTYKYIAGKTMGTIYKIAYQDSSQLNRQKEVDDLLIEFNQSLSTYIPASTISKANRESGKIEVDAYFARVFQDAQAIYTATEGAFDPTIMPVVNFWGFGFEEIPERDETKLAELQASMGFHELKLMEDQSNYKVYLEKPRLETQIDFSAIAKGTGVDVIAEYLDRNDIANYMINIGGEVRTRGKNDKNQWWKLGVNVPLENADPNAHQEIVSLQNQSMATSGNYRNHKIIDGKKAVHTIDPKTARPVVSNLLSATIVAKDCALADAYATACMVVGLEQAKKLIENDYRLEGLLLFGNDAGEIESWKSTRMETVPALAIP